MGKNALRAYGARRVYETTVGAGGSLSLRLRDHVVELGAPESRAYAKLVEWLPTTQGITDLEASAGMDEARLLRLAPHLVEAGLLYPRADIPASLSGKQFYEEHFAPVLDAWLGEAFSHPFWERMTSGRGSARLHSGWTMELYHYTKNANRHMPLSSAHSREKAIKLLRAKHYAEEWNHYHYFAKALRYLGFTNEAVEASVPLPMTLALSNFMRQAAREDILAYSICSAVLEGTTVNRSNYNPYHEKVIELYGVPREAVKPIYDHLDLDIQYQHSNLFLDILGTVD
ncbi:MAG TPA: iron-containing redox enzyme family protein, partial [Polyangiaceae bacterium]|nr:iron-containing redox enzyme family protein [Polyangiaceae bacterium]